MDKKSKEPKISVVIPFHWMRNWQFFLNRCLSSIEKQSFIDYEVILTKAGSMPINTNRAIQCAKGEIIKILYMDDILAEVDSLQKVVDIFQDGIEWLITGCDNNLIPKLTDDIETGNNKLGSPSCLSFRNHFGENLLFDENMSFLLDCDLYKRMSEKYGAPKILEGKHVIMGIGEHQMSNILTNEEKMKEFYYMKKKYGKGV